MRYPLGILLVLTSTTCSDLSEVSISFFNNCVTVLITSGNITVVTEHPIISITKLNGVTNSVPRMRGKAASRRKWRGAPYCWAFFVVEPTKKQLEVIPLDNFLPPFITQTSRPQFIILITERSSQASVKSWIDNHTSYSTMMFWSRELIFAYLWENRTGTTFSYHNKYYSKTVSNTSEPWISVECHNLDVIRDTCFPKISTVSEQLSKLNKYYWRPFDRDEPTFAYSKFHRLHEELLKNGETKWFFENLASSTTIDEFLCIWILEDVLRHEMLPLAGGDQINAAFIVGSLNFNTFYSDIILLRTKSLKFLSCHQVGHHVSTFGPLFSPFDGETWLCILLSFTLTSLLISLLLKSYSVLSGAFLPFGILVESSVLSGINLSKVNATACHLLIGIWVVMIGTVLTNWYKTSFTMEMIVPEDVTAPWRTFIDVADFNFFIPVEFFNFDPGLSIDYDGLIRSFYYKLFLFLKRLTWPHPQFGDTNIVEGRNDIVLRWHDAMTAAATWNMGYPAFKSVEVLRPLMYNSTEHFIKNLTGCEHVGYLDTGENIDSLLAFLNDKIMRRKSFMKGEDEILNHFQGWELPSIRNSYVFERMKIMVSSGIYGYIDSWYKRVKPMKLFNHYAPSNETREDINGVFLGLGFSSKISTAFWIGGIMIVLSLVVSLGEVIVYGLWH
ncbi:hypothetical protein Fcan01_24232 [Folsomia candida]|uniref:Uncharacterized protein n=1 Tax=Folsomia candida TaxID=158441 RepID=A0A226D5J1_FOLCA|nr:hypothetical protein Fcan01_24232 [Folsomia candida]